MSYRKCEICGYDDIETNVYSSSLGAFSMNYCLICSALGAEQSGMQDIVGDYTTYNSNDDMYYDSSYNHIVIKLKNGKEFNTRTECANYLNRNKKD